MPEIEKSLVVSLVEFLRKEGDRLEHEGRPAEGERHLWTRCRKCAYKTYADDLERILGGPRP